MPIKTDAEQTTIGSHIRNTVFAAEVAALDEESEGISVGADMYGKLDFGVVGDSVAVADLEAKWTAHQSGCPDGCAEWHL